jgi:cell division protein FtsA
MVMLEVERSGYRNRLAGGIVLTGGGAMLKNIRQLFEYKTGMDIRIGYPNEHLGKSAYEEVKNPMYATAVGLVLAGFQGMIETEDEPIAHGIHNRAKSKKGSGVSARDFLSSMLKKTKSLLIDDYDDKNIY